ncbi:hypothetical protein H310_00573 [Aphanomyces invadans]|uniref:Uncharacterized protein n=1 Tax=Aphanomyces invadans TaxID=157072 RepID=A0A024UW75_9STRA|nr:hypothetical protein H310_00573 [Aphanomyces invadans]ETW10215.1 hypothetical protein H310_00573 [Aphanomyces invadans]|eukprot:XP_008861626.1 hypothetical protein H310_00573 [Aphanomyces invadans]
MSQKEIYSDVVEEIDSIEDSHGCCIAKSASRSTATAVSLDDSTKTLKWTVGKFNPKKVMSPSLKGSIVLQHGAATLDENPIVLFGSNVPFTAGVRTLAHAGRFQKS